MTALPCSQEVPTLTCAASSRMTTAPSSTCRSMNASTWPDASALSTPACQADHQQGRGEVLAAACAERHTWELKP
jgi:hypothetical protein